MQNQNPIIEFQNLRAYTEKNANEKSIDNIIDGQRYSSLFSSNSYIKKWLKSRYNLAKNDLQSFYNMVDIIFQKLSLEKKAHACFLLNGASNYQLRNGFRFLFGSEELYN